jgi:hypothetical protein
MSHQYKITKHGTIDIFIVESNPVIFKGELYRFEYIRHHENGKRYRFNLTGDSYFRFVNVETSKISAPFGKGLHLGNVFVWEDRIYVTAAENWGKSRFYQLESDDMLNWSKPRLILENPEWEGYNSSMCRTDDGFLLTFELGAPADIVGIPFTMFFAKSKDLKTWELIPDTVFGRDIYTGGPMIRYYSGWYYFFYLDGSHEDGFRETVARSKDLKNWTWGSKNPILEADSKDKILKGEFTESESESILKAVNNNNSDMDMCEWKNKLYIVYSWGNQWGTEFLAEAEAGCTEQEFCESFFE